MGGWKFHGGGGNWAGNGDAPSFSSTAFHLKAPLALFVGLSGLANIEEKYSTG